MEYDILNPVQTSAADIIIELNSVAPKELRLGY